MAAADNDIRPIDHEPRRSQQFMFGVKAARKISEAKVFIGGLGNLGIEIALNLIHTGVKEITINNKYRQDKEKCDRLIQDSLESLGSKLHSHNNVNVQFDEESILVKDAAFWQQYDCVLLTGVPLVDQVKVNKICRELSPPVKFISADFLCAVGYVFCDFGDSFVINDLHSGSTEAVIGSLTKGNQTKVSLIDNKENDFFIDDEVRISDIDKNHHLSGQNFTITGTSSGELTIDVDTELVKFDGEVFGGKLVLHERLRKYSFKCLDEELTYPTLNNTYEDYRTVRDKLEFIYRLKESNTCSCELGLETNFETSLRLSKDRPLDHMETKKRVEETLSRTFCTTFGGFIANEVNKSIAGTFRPIVQWEIWNCNEFGCKHTKTLSNKIGTSLSTVDIEKPLENSTTKIFIVGCRAICSALAKNIAYLEKSKLQSFKITLSRIDDENFRQRRKSYESGEDLIQGSTTDLDDSTWSGISGLDINVLTERFCPEKESALYTDEFFKNQDVVISAVDSTVTRRYLNGRCVANNVALIDIGVAGFKGHLQVAYPHLTQSYSSQRDPIDKEVPYCTVKSFPEAVEHTVVWAREKFISMFCERPRIYNKFWEIFGSPSKLLKVIQTSGRKPDGFCDGMKLFTIMPRSSRDCVLLARNKFDKYFNFKAKQLLHSLPATTRTSDGSLFWSYPKKIPKPVEFSSEDPLHILFVTTMAKLSAKIFNIKSDDKDFHTNSITEITREYQCPEFHTSDKEIETDPAAKKTEKVDENKIERYMKYLEEHGIDNNNTITRLKAKTYSKYLQNKDHADFIYAASSLRAIVYGIRAVDQYETKLICGNLLPILHSTATVAVGLATLELIKLLSCDLKESYRSSVFNLSLPVLVRWTPAPPLVTVVKGSVTFTEWDKWEVYGSPEFTLGDFTKHFKDKYSLVVGLVVQGVKIIFMPFMPGHSKRLKERMISLLDTPSDKSYTDLTVSFENDEIDQDQDVPAPPIRYFL